MSSDPLPVNFAVFLPYFQNEMPDFPTGLHLPCQSWQRWKPEAIGRSSILARELREIVARVLAAARVAAKYAAFDKIVDVALGGWN